MRYDKVRKNAVCVLSLTSLTVSEFEDLVPTFKSHWDDYYSHYTLKGKVRKRISCGRKTGKLLFILSCLKNNPLQEYHGSCHDMTQPQCNEWIHYSAQDVKNARRTA
ncbi:MAG: DDE transposase family protein, partial [Prevotellaceae bacterium]|nr:DDE transposase family protein [Prevotellaceae bacterium]